MRSVFVIQFIVSISFPVFIHSLRSLFVVLHVAAHVPTGPRISIKSLIRNELDADYL